MSQPSIPKKEKNIIKQFCIHCKKHFNYLPCNLLEDHEIQKHISYTKKQKLMAVSYIMTTRKPKKDGSIKFITKKSVTLNLRITMAMLQD